MAEVYPAGPEPMMSVLIFSGIRININFANILNISGICPIRVLEFPGRVQVRLKTCGGEKFRKGLWQKLLIYSKIAIFVCRAQQIEELGHYEN